ncbi:Uncharacterised protein [Actinomyces bovis]|uniref:Cell division protein FtsL n=1 Tax=Actinomyces bovis TaxID=1658 RepID=A0ABY1VP77_9ACTO|nr:hypothetical protein [Actinomyces bovis]SPT53925.1 Uncharacterised protein [Actinomyces bovis]VEG53414.1 Uncharacterised protein [Actinomyces israelii]
MTAQAARARSASRAMPRLAPQPRPNLSVVRGLNQVRFKLPILGMVVALLLSTLILILVLTALMARTAGELQRTRELVSEVREASVVLQSQLDQRSSSAELSTRAQKLGMVPAGAPGVVNLRDGSLAAGKPAAVPTPAASAATGANAAPPPVAAPPAAAPEAASPQAAAEPAPGAAPQPAAAPEAESPQAAAEPAPDATKQAP